MSKKDDNLAKNIKEVTVLWLKYHHHVAAFVSSFIYSVHDAEDIVQETGLAVVDHFNQYDPNKPFLGWVIGIARHKISDYLRKNHRDRHLFDTETLDRMADCFNEMDQEVDDMRIALKQCIKKLPGRSHLLLECRYLKDMPIDRIAECMNLKVNYIYSALYRVRKALGDCIKRKIASYKVGS